MNSITLNRVWAIGVIAALLSLATGMSLYAGSEAQAATAPVISAVSATTTSTGATVTWTTDEAADSQVVYGTSTPYSATSTLNTATTTTHSVALSGLTPSTLYHYAVISMGSTSTNMSGDNTFITSGTSTAAVTLSVTSGAPGSLVTITGSGFLASEPITLMWNGTSTLSANAAGGFSTTLTVPSVSTGPLPVSATGVTSGRVATNSFSVTSGAITGSLTGTITSTTTDLAALQNRVAMLESQVSTMQAQISALQSQFAMHMSGHGTTTMGTPPTGPARIDQNGRSLSLGTSIDFGGHNFGLEETVLVTLNGQTVATAHADGGGNFSTGSMNTPSAVGTYTYQFTGQNSGRSATATITVTP